MAEKERYTTTVDGELLRQIKILAINERCPTNKLLEEAIRDLLKKYEEKPNKERNLFSWKNPKKPPLETG